MDTTYIVSRVLETQIQVAEPRSTRRGNALCSKGYRKKASGIFNSINTGEVLDAQSLRPLLILLLARFGASY